MKECDKNMAGNEIIALIITSVIGLGVVVLGILFSFGKAAFLIAGFNTMSEEEREKYDEKAMAKFLGKITIPIGLLTPLVAIAGIYDMNWLICVYFFIVLSLSVFAIIYANTKDRFIK